LSIGEGEIVRDDGGNEGVEENNSERRRRTEEARAYLGKVGIFDHDKTLYRNQNLKNRTSRGTPRL